jgi:hypothetical protein
MGGAFVAVANDSSATWWNPAGLAAGPFLDGALSHAVTSADRGFPARRERVAGFALGTPPLAVSYYRFRITNIAAASPTAQDRAGREEGRADRIDSLDLSQLGVTVVQTLFPGVHAATTLRFVRGTVRHAIPVQDDAALDPGNSLDRGDDLEGGDAENRFDLDVGLLATHGAARIGAVVRNLREVDFGGMGLPRQARVGVALDFEAVGQMPLMVAIDADVLAYATGTGERRVIALGAERWFSARRLGVRAGARVNTAGAAERAVTAGASWSPRPGLYVDGHVTGGPDRGERGWGLAARVSF